LAPFFWDNLLPVNTEQQIDVLRGNILPVTLLLHSSYRKW